MRSSLPNRQRAPLHLRCPSAEPPRPLPAAGGFTSALTPAHRTLPTARGAAPVPAAALGQPGSCQARPDPAPPRRHGNSAPSQAPVP